MALGVVPRDRRRDVLQHQRLTRFRRRHQQSTLAFTDRCSQINDPSREVFSRPVTDLHAQTLGGKQRRQVLEENLMLGVFRAVKVDLANFEQGKVALALFGRADFAGNGVAFAQIETTNL